jgi:hypothetical protein
MSLNKIYPSAARTASTTPSKRVMSSCSQRAVTVGVVVPASRCMVGDEPSCLPSPPPTPDTLIAYAETAEEYAKAWSSYRGRDT